MLRSALDTFKVSRKLLQHTSYLQTRKLSSEVEKWDVVIAGGGMVGFALAASLGRSTRLSNLRVLILETSRATENKSWQNVPYANRVSAISPPSRQLFETLDAWESMCSIRAGQVKKMQVWESESDSYISFGNGISDIAHVIENDVLLECLKNRVPSSVTVRYQCRASSYELPKDINDEVMIKLDDGTEISARLLVGCDGANSLVRKSLEADYMSWEYDRMGVVATLKMDTEPGFRNNTAWQKFLPSGPIALLPLTDNLSSLVWSTQKSHAKALLKMNPEDFTDALNSSLWTDGQISMPEWIRDLEQACTKIVRNAGASINSSGYSPKQLPPSISQVVDGSRAAFPLGLGHAVQYTGPRVALLGDAAHRVHPLAGQGVNLGFGDVASLTRTLEEAVFTGEDIGSFSCLQQYETERQQKNVPMMAAIDSLHRLYSTTWPPAVLLRSVGLSAVDSLRPIKSRIESFIEKA